MKSNINYLHTSGLSGHRPTKILLIGAGGNGSLMLSRLYKMHVALTALGQPGFDVSLCDPDTVSSANMGRQPFFQSDIGANKAETLIWRLCGSAGDLSWTAIPRRAECEDLRNADMVITCVDTISSRRQIHQWLESSHYTTTKYWLDMGNEADTGQVVLGQIEHRMATGAASCRPSQNWFPRSPILPPRKPTRLHALWPRHSKSKTCSLTNKSSCKPRRCCGSCSRNEWFAIPSSTSTCGISL